MLLFDYIPMEWLWDVIEWQCIQLSDVKYSPNFILLSFCLWLNIEEKSRDQVKHLVASWWIILVCHLCFWYVCHILCKLIYNTHVLLLIVLIFLWCCNLTYKNVYVCHILAIAMIIEERYCTVYWNHGCVRMMLLYVCLRCLNNFDI